MCFHSYAVFSLLLILLLPLENVARTGHLVGVTPVVVVLKASSSKQWQQRDQGAEEGCPFDKEKRHHDVTEYISKDCYFQIKAFCVILSSANSSLRIILETCILYFCINVWRLCGVSYIIHWPLLWNERMHTSSFHLRYL